MPVTAGMRGEASLTVDQSHTGGAGGGNLPTLALPALVALLERAAAHAVRRGLAPGEETFGTTVNVRYLSPASIGRFVRAEAVVTAVADSKISFTVRAFDSTGT